MDNGISNHFELKRLRTAVNASERLSGKTHDIRRSKETPSQKSRQITVGDVYNMRCERYKARVSDLM